MDRLAQAVLALVLSDESKLFGDARGKLRLLAHMKARYRPRN